MQFQITRLINGTCQVLVTDFILECHNDVLSVAAIINEDGGGLWGESTTVTSPIHGVRRVHVRTPVCSELLREHRKRTTNSEPSN
jgi:hypothetical protein